jgi:hypothetical protein
MKWLYHPYAVDKSRICPSGVVFRLEAKLCVRGATGEAIVRALIDTGADHTLLPISISRDVGAELFPQERDAAKGVGGHEIAVIPGRVQLELISDEESRAWDAVIGFAQFDNPEEECSILGHSGCLEYFLAAFDGVTQVVELTPRAIPPNSG